jgi:hypothetical protein
MMGLMMDKEDGPLFKNNREKKMTLGSDLKNLETAMKPAAQSPALSEEEKREQVVEFKRITDCFVKTLNNACSKKKKRR